MSQDLSMIIVDANGVQCAVAHEATADSNGEAQVLVRFQSGEQVLLPRELLRQQEDGRYRLTGSVEKLLGEYAINKQTDSLQEQTGDFVSNGRSRSSVGSLPEEQELVIPIVDEFANVETRVVETGKVEVHKTVHERTEVVDQPLFSEEVEIERVTINRPLEEAVGARYEGDTLVIPLLEEVLVIQKQLVLREEVHIKKLRKEMHDPQEVLLRTEEVNVVRKPSASADFVKDESVEE
jgi:uncharacterized protein (TIGR02271 family)